jgi:hypothetical protein
MGFGPPGRERGEGESIYGRGIRFFCFSLDACVRLFLVSFYFIYLFGNSIFLF